MRAPNVQHRGYEGDRESHRLYCTYVHYSRGQGKQKVRRASSSSSPGWLPLPSLPLQGMEAGEAGQCSCHCRGSGSGALWWVSGTARGAPSLVFEQRVSRAWMEMKPAAEQRAGTVPTCTSRSFPRPGNRACVSTRDATPHRRHHPWIGDPEDPAPSATLCRPISHHPRVCLPSHRRGGLSLRPAASGRACGWGGVPWCVL